ncbi:inorganic diphosphatase, partial [Gammaproteobacteria bacterium]|nr:inorganic diphosphatase [Gammaproteobacteria bacterium]
MKTFSKNGFLQMVVEIPAGTNKKIEYDKNINEFFIDKIDGVDRVINFLPYPGNYGFIPSTKMD